MKKVKICFCCSTKFYDSLGICTKMLDDVNISYYTPNTAITCKEDAIISENDKMQLTIDHQEKILHSDVVYIINPEWYIGESVSMEMSFAKGAGKEVFAQEPAQSPAKAAYIKEIISMSDLLRRLISPSV